MGILEGGVEGGVRERLRKGVLPGFCCSVSILRTWSSDLVVSGAHLIASIMMPLQRDAKSLTVPSRPSISSGTIRLNGTEIGTLISIV